MSGDLTRPETLAGRCEGTDTVVHTAGLVEDWGPEDRFRAINIDGTKALPQEAKAAGIRRFVCVLTEPAICDQ